MTTLLLLSIFLIIGSAFVSLSEASIFSVSKIKVQTMMNAGDNNAKRLFFLKENMNNTIGTLVLLANIFGIVGALFVGQLLEPLKNNFEYWSLQGFLVGNYEIIYTFFVILFGEIIPKNAGEKFNLKIAILSTPFIIVLAFLFKPILLFFQFISRLIFGNNPNSETTSEAEVMAMTDLGLESHSIEADEHKIIQNVFMMNDKSAKDIMTPRVQMVAMDKDKTLNQQQKEIYSSQHSRLPVFGEDYDDIIGFVLLRDILEAMAKDNGNIKPDCDELLNDIVAVREATKIDQLLIVFQQKRTHIAIVVDDFGGTSGLVTLEDVLEQLVGEIVDETDTVVDLRTLKNDNQREIKMAEVV
jgi:CBS domain containing-hemolysin-like protein